MLLSFYPGVLYGPDLEEQFAQASGQIPFNDWHPPLMALVWKWGMWLTSKPSCLFIFEITLFVGSLLVFALSGYRRGKLDLLWACLITLLPLYAPLLIQSGRLWKDQFLTFCLLAAIASLWVGGKKRGQCWSLALFFMFAAAAILLRANGFFAVVFLLPLAGTKIRALLPHLQSGQGKTKRLFRSRTVIAIGCACLALIVATAGLNATVKIAAQPTKTHQIDQLFLDDLINTSSPTEVMDLPLSGDFKKFLSSAITRCSAEGHKQNLMWYSCADGKRITIKDGTTVFSSIHRFHPEFMKAWFAVIPQHPFKYVGYRMEVFSHFIFDTWPANLGKIKEHFSPRFSAAFTSTSSYTDSVSSRWAPFLFCPATYLLINLATICFLQRRKGQLSEEHHSFAFWLSAASLFWLVSQIPIVPVSDYRYSYFSIATTALAVAVLMGGLSLKTKTPGGHASLAR